MHTPLLLESIMCEWPLLVEIATADKGIMVPVMVLCPAMNFVSTSAQSGKGLQNPQSAVQIRPSTLASEKSWFPGLFRCLTTMTRPKATESNKGPLHPCLLGTANTSGPLHRLPDALPGKWLKISHDPAKRARDY
jgi:hypothetical protein